jgi:hypothetical protein
VLRVAIAVVFMVFKCTAIWNPCLEKCNLATQLYALKKDGFLLLWLSGSFLPSS